MLARSFLVSAVLLGLTGCEVYFADDDDGDTYSYCDESGCYECDDWGCWPDTPNDGWSCTNNYDCAAGCACVDGFCEELGFCTEDSDCRGDLICDDRASCVPPDSNGTCEGDSDCPVGSYCDQESGLCIGSWTCDTNEESSPSDGSERKSVR